MSEQATPQPAESKTEQKRVRGKVLFVTAVTSTIFSGLAHMSPELFMGSRTGGAGLSGLYGRVDYLDKVANLQGWSLAVAGVLWVAFFVLRSLPGRVGEAAPKAKAGSLADVSTRPQEQSRHRGVEQHERDARARKRKQSEQWILAGHCGVCGTKLGSLERLILRNACRRHW